MADEGINITANCGEGSNLLNVKVLLGMLTELLPPKKGQRHNLTIDEKGVLVLTLMLDEGMLDLKILDDENLKRNVGSVVAEISIGVQAMRRRSSGRLPSITEQPCRCDDCGWSGVVLDCEGDVDGEGSLGCPQCLKVVEVF